MRLRKKLHPNIWIFIEGLQKEEVKMVIDYVRVSTSTKKDRGRNKKIQKDLDIVAAKAAYGNSTRSFLDIEKLLDIYTNIVPESFLFFIGQLNKFTLSN